MPGTERFDCSSVSAASGEPLTGTASRYRLWIMLEQPGAWGHQALIESKLPVEVGSALRVLGRDLGIRVLLVKRRDRRSKRPRAFFAYTGTRDRRLRFLDLDDPRDLLDLDLPDLAARHFAGVGEEVIGPLFLVCTHGKHDPCCARLGGPLFRALVDAVGEAAWEATHIGGDRFAGNLVCFPHGVYYGRLSPEEAAGVADGYARGRLDLRFYRGRSCYPPAIQAAEHFLRSELNITAIGDLAVRGHRSLPANRHRTEWETPAGRYVVDVEIVRRAEQVLTCKADHPGRPRGFELRAIAAAKAAPPQATG